MKQIRILLVISLLCIGVILESNAQFSLKYDSDALRYIPLAKDEKTANSLGYTAKVMDKNTIKFTTNTDSNTLIENGTIATFTYEVLEPSDVTLSLTEVKIEHKDGKQLRLVPNHAWVIKPAIINEDANRDWQVDVTDLEFVSARLGQTGKGNTADINGYGIVDIADLVLVRKALYGPETENTSD